jgi:hypothetical protein
MGRLAVASAIVLTIAACSEPARLSAQRAAPAAEHFVPSRPETVTWGSFPLDRTPVLTIQSGQTVRIDTLTHAGATCRRASFSRSNGSARTGWTNPKKSAQWRRFREEPLYAGLPVSMLQYARISASREA